MAKTNNPPPDFLIYDLSHTIKKVTRIVIGHIHYYVFFEKPGFSLFPIKMHRSFRIRAK